MLSSAVRFLSKGIFFAAVTATGLSLGSCDSWIYDDQGDCAVRYSVSFTFKQNMLSADAFASQVKSVTLYVVDKDGKIVASKTDKSDAIANPGYSMSVDVKPGLYDLYVWGEGESPISDHTAFVIGGGANPSSVTELSATLPLNGSVNDQYCDLDITPLFHGVLSDVNFPDTYGDINLGPVDLMRDTHQLQVLIQTTDGSAIPPEEFSFYVEGNNSQMSYLNMPSASPWFEYRPWYITMTSASFDTPETRADEVNGLMAEFTTGRLMADRSPRLVIHRNSDDTNIISINLIQYLLMVKGEYNRQLTNQQYLDRKESHTMMFFLDQYHDWYVGAGVYINGWRIVPPQVEDL